MRVVKLGLISIVVLFLLALAMSSLLPSTINISRPIDLTASPDSVHAYVSKLDNWKYWLAGMDTIPVEVVDEKTLVFNNTKVTVTSITSEKITTVWQTGNGRPMKGEFNFIVQEGAPHFTLQWQFVLQLKWYPWEKFSSIMSDKAIGPFMENSLEKLEAIVEGSASR